MADYLYNGVRLPALPVVEYPFALIETAVKDSDGTISGITLFYFAGNAYYTATESGTLYFGGIADSSISDEKVAAKIYRLSDDKWSLTSEKDDHAVIIPPPEGYTAWGVTRTLTWANFDVEYNGTLYLAASDPVPVTETDHNARIMGWIVGKRLAAQRGRA